MKLHTVFITYNRLDLTKQAVASYLETVSVPFTFTIVDNASNDGTQAWISNLQFKSMISHHLLNENRYPGFAANLGWKDAPKDATHFQRADNDFAFLPGWCEELKKRFRPRVGQVGLRTGKEELFAKHNVGGNCVIAREIWDKGLRYDERPWTEYPPGYSEDSFFSPKILEMGWKWRRVKVPCIKSLASGDWNDEYYQKSYGDRRIERPA